ncbi:hypothetical protein KCU85_g243, partial [Aureobasidium melanogenum]
MPCHASQYQPLSPGSIVLGGMDHIRVSREHVAKSFRQAYPFTCAGASGVSGLVRPTENHESTLTQPYFLFGTIITLILACLILGPCVKSAAATSLRGLWSGFGICNLLVGFLDLPVSITLNYPYMTLLRYNFSVNVSPALIYRPMDVNCTGSRAPFPSIAMV